MLLSSRQARVRRGRLVVQNHNIRQRLRPKSEARKALFSLTVHGIKLEVKVGTVVSFL